MAITLWIVQSILGLLFIITGSFKFFQSKEKIIASGGTWAEDFKPAIVKAIAATELVCGLVVLLCKILGHGGYLPFIGAACIVLIMIGSIFVHIRRKEMQHAAINTVFLLMALFVAYASRPC